MRLTAIFLLSACLQVSAKSGAQGITLSLKNAPLEKVFTEINKQTGYSFVYNNNLIADAKKVTITVTSVPVEEVLQLAFKDQPLTYEIIEKTIIVKPKSPNGQTTPEPDPPIDITGRITNEHGEPMAGASVVIKRTGKGDIADANGNFKLKNVNSNDIITISFAGYKTQNIKVGSIINFTIVMEIATNELDKVEVKAYGTTTQRLATGNIATVTAAEIERQPVMNPLQALQGRVAGLDIQQQNGYASSPIKVEIRGRNTINPLVTSDPLYIIDGVPLTILELGGNSSYNSGSTGFMQGTFVGPDGGQSPFFSINPGDIESITVLKDADATAIYGSRGANGVIIINTKKGKTGKAKFEMNIYQGVAKVTRYYRMLNTQQYLQMRKEAFKNDNRNPSVGSAYDLLVWDSTRYTDWQKYAWGGTGKTTDAEFSFSGGDIHNTFRIGAGYHRQTDITTVSGAAQRGSVQFNLFHNSSDNRLTIGFTNVYTIAEANLINIQGLATLPPNAPPAFDNKGNLNYRGWDPVAFRFPFSNLLRPYSATTNFLNSNLQIKYEFFGGLNFTTNFGYSFAIATQRQTIPIASFDPLQNPTGSASFGYNNTKNWIIEPQVNYKKFINKGKMEILIGASLQTVSTNGNSISGEGYANDNLLGSISNAPVKDASDYFGRYKYAALFSQVNYNWENKYIINLSARRDGSSRFGPGNQYGNFGAVGVAWIFTEGNWFKKHFSFLSSGKLRSSYGTTGSDQIGDYQYLTRWTSSNLVPYQGFQSYTPTQHFNPDYHWAENRKLEAALDLSFLKDRISIGTALYRNRSDNQLVSFPLPIQTGFPNVTANSPANVQNTGLEFLLNSKIIDRKEIFWNVRFNLSINRNKLLAYPNLSQSPYAFDYVVGKPLNISNLLHYTGVDPKTGLYTFEDRNKDGMIIGYGSANSDVFSYNLNPKFTGAFGSDFTFKGWSLNLFFYFKEKIDRNAYASGRAPGAVFNVPVQILDHWTMPGDHATFARVTTRPDISDNNFQSSNGILSNASFIKLSNLSFSYDFPDQVLKKMHLKYSQIYFQGQNLLLISHYKGIDPEVPYFGSMPQSKIFTVGIKLSL